MRHKIPVLLTTAAALSLAALLALRLLPEKPVRVACVGDSITRGAYLEDRRSQCYPARLAARLGPGYTVRNFGVNSATVQNAGDKPYREQSAFFKSIAWNPQIVVLMLGTNDTKTQNRDTPERFAEDYEALLMQYAAGSAKPQIWLVAPPPIFVLDDKSRPSFSMHRETLLQEIEIISRIAKEKGLPLIHLYDVLGDQPQYFQLDGVHPDARGAQVIADTVYDALMQDLP